MDLIYPHASARSADALDVSSPVGWSASRSATYLGDQQPHLFKDGLVHIFLDALCGLGVQQSGLAGQLREQTDLLVVRNLLLQEDLLALSEHDADQGLDRLSTEIGGWRMQEVLVDVGKHAGGRLKGVVGRLEPAVLRTVLVGGMTGEDGGDVEDDGRFLVRQRELRRRLVGKGIEPVRRGRPVSPTRCRRKTGAGSPGKRDLDVILIDGKPQVQQLQLTVVSIQQIPAGGAVLAGTPHVLTESVQGGTFLGIPLRIVAVGLTDVGLEGMDPVDLVGLLQRAADHRRLHRRGGAHLGRRAAQGPDSVPVHASADPRCCSSCKPVGHLVSDSVMVLCRLYDDQGGDCLLPLRASKADPLGRSCCSRHRPEHDDASRSCARKVGRSVTRESTFLT